MGGLIIEFIDLHDFQSFFFDCCPFSWDTRLQQGFHPPRPPPSTKRGRGGPAGKPGAASASASTSASSSEGGRGGEGVGGGGEHPGNPLDTDAKGCPISLEARRHRDRFRVRCPACTTTFCASCSEQVRKSLASLFPGGHSTPAPAHWTHSGYSLDAHTHTHTPCTLNTQIPHRAGLLSPG